MREIRKMVEDEGLTLVSIDMAGSGNLKVRVADAANTVHMMMFSATPSDWRATHNRRAHLRRIAKAATTQ